LKRGQIESINTFLAALQPPQLMKRLPRTIRQLGGMKATVLLAITLYYALPCFYGILEKKAFLTIAKFLASSQYLFSGSITEAGLLKVSCALLHFGQELQEAIGPRYMTYNMHQLIIHLTDYVFHLGPPEEFWAFPFESHIGTLKRYLQSTQEQNKELAGKVCLSEAADILMDLKLYKSPDLFLQEAARFLCTNLHRYDETATTESRKAYGRSSAQKMTELLKSDPVLHNKLFELLRRRIPGAPEDFSIFLYDRCITETNIWLNTLSYTKSKLHVDCGYLRDDEQMYLAVKFLKVVRKSTAESVFLVCSKVLEQQEWDYFGFAEDEILREDIFQRSYRCVKPSENMELHRSSEIKAVLMMLADRNGNELAVPVLHCFPN
jgi:hypothetical protein